MNYKVSAPSGLNVRSGPGTDYEILGVLTMGQIISVIDTTVWLPFIQDIDENGDITFGWVSSKYLDRTTTAPPVPIITKTGQAVVTKAMTQTGDPYVYGAEVDLDDPDPTKFDCSELVQWVCHQLNIQPEMPDGSANQRAFCEHYGTMISIEDAVKTAGALLFGDGHVAISRGDGSTIEARGKDYGVGSWSSKNRPWVAAAKIPGVSYGV